MSENPASQAKLSPELPSSGRPGPCHTCKNGRRQEPNSFSACQHGPSKLACASSRPEHPHNNAPAFNSLQTHPPNAHRRPPESLSFSRTMPRHSTPGPQSPIRHGDNNGQASLEEHPSGYAVEARRYSFFVFPPEIRNMIYRLSLKQPSCADLFRNYRHSVATRPEGQRWTRTHLETPTILLLCKRITDESIPVLRAMSFIVDRLPPCMPPLPDGRGGFLRMINFIGRETLQQLKFIDIRIGLGDGSLGSGWIWNRVFDEVLLILSEKNSLVHLRVLIRRCNEEENLSIWDAELTEERSIRKKIKWFQLTNPNTFRPCDITVETWRIDGQEATFLDCIDKWDQVKHPEQLCRSYPDPELFPGSIMQFVDALREADGSGGEG